MKFFTKISIAALLAFAAIFAIYFIYNKTATTPVVSNTANINTIHDKEYNFPKPNFDGSVKISGTGVVVEYPKKGFYDLGAEISFSKIAPYTLGSANIAVSAEYDPIKASEYIVLSVGIRQKKDNETMETIANLENKNIEALAPGQLTTINGKEYFIQKSIHEATSITEWYGASIVNNKTILVTMKFGQSGWDGIPSAESLAAYKNNDKLFLDILGHIKF
jgi:hypothetical protein